jgi:hypothetical protein
MNKLTQEPEKDIWASMRENRLRRERWSKCLTPIFYLASPFVPPAIIWFMAAELPCGQNQQITHIGLQNHQLVQFQPVKTDTNEAFLACTLHNSSIIYSATGDAFHYIQAHSGEILVWGTLIILFCAGVQLLLWSIKAIFS